MIRYDAASKTIHMNLVDLEHCGFDHELYRSELFCGGLDEDDEGLLWPDWVIVNFAGGAVVIEDVVEMYDNRDADNDTALKEATAIIYEGIELLHEVDKLREWSGVRAWLEKWGRE